MNIFPRNRWPGAAGIRNTARKKWPNSNTLSGGRSAATNRAGALKASFDRTKISKTRPFTEKRCGVDYLLAGGGPHRCRPFKKTKGIFALGWILAAPR